MAHPNGDTRSSLYTRLSRQTQDIVRPRGRYANETLSSPLTRAPSHNPANPPSPHHEHLPHTAPTAFCDAPHHLTVLHAYSFGNQSPDAQAQTFSGAPHTVGWTDYRPGHDPPAHEPAHPHQPDWSTLQGLQNAYPDPSRDWVSNMEPSMGTLYHGMAPMTGYVEHARPWDGQQIQMPVFSTPGSSGYSRNSGLAPPAETQWSPMSPSPAEIYYGSRPPPTPTTCSPNTEVGTPFSPQPIGFGTPSPSRPFAHFPEQDRARDLAYAEQGGPISEAANNEMLGMGHRVNSLDSDYAAHSLEQTQASTSNHAAEIQADSSPRPLQLSANIDMHFPNLPRLKQLAQEILDQPWCENNEEEPPVKNADLVVRLKLVKRTPKSRFEPFFDDKLRCRVVEANGTRCEHVSTRKDRAVGHARAHFGYKPFTCNGHCGKTGCGERYTCASFRNDHIGRKKNPKRACPLCQKPFTAQNLKRHMKQHPEHSAASEPSPSSPPADDRPSPKKRKISILRFSFIRK